ncbi:MAG: NUDIX domain-containing protein [Thaumarchaeota archaeon]|nr:NUDIX domain-containing protein [Nitrososphaerota archaeon]
MTQANEISATQSFPEPTVGGLIKRPDGTVLLCDSHKWPGFYTVPGGHVELGETCEDALVREIKEEVGLDIKVDELLSIQQVIYPKEFWKRAHFIFFDYLCTVEGDQSPKVDANEIQATIWVTPQNALNLNIDRYLKYFITRLLDRSTPFIVSWK